MQSKVFFTFLLSILIVKCYCTIIEDDPREEFNELSPRFQASSTVASTVSVSTAVPNAFTTPDYSIYGPGRGPQPLTPQPGYGYYSGAYCVNRVAFVKDMSRIESLMRDMQEKNRILSNDSDSLKQMAHMYARLIAGITSTRL